METSELPKEAGGGSMTQTSMFSDYRKIDGISYAHKIKQSFGPQVLDMEVTSVEHNTKLGDEIFE